MSTTDPLLHQGVIIWSWGCAPAPLRALSNFGGGEAYIAVVPPHLADNIPKWLKDPRHRLQIITKMDGSVIRIGAR